MIHREDRGEVVVLRMEHGKVNALDVELCAAVASEFEALTKSRAGAVVLTGTGSSFSAGVDLVRVIDAGRAYIERFLPVLSDALLKVFAYPLPVVAAINGHAIAGGCILACACDQRIMAEGPGWMGIPELMVGVPLPAVAMEVLRFAVPRPYLAQLMYSGRTVAVPDALRFGLIDEMVSADRLLEHACAMASRLASIPSRAFEITKRELRGPYLKRLDAVRKTADAESLEAWSAPETLETIRAYVARTIKKRF